MPVLVPAVRWVTGDGRMQGAEFAGYEARSARSIAEEAMAIFSKCMTPEGRTQVSGCAHKVPA